MDDALEQLSMLSEETGNCCGFTTIYQFDEQLEDYNRWGPERKRRYHSDLEVVLKEVISEACSNLLVIITEQQARLIDYSLRKRGFEQIRAFNNPNTDNTLYMYVWEYDDEYHEKLDGEYRMQEFPAPVCHPDVYKPAPKAKPKTPAKTFSSTPSTDTWYSIKTMRVISGKY